MKFHLNHTATINLFELQNGVHPAKIKNLVEKSGEPHKIPSAHMDWSSFSQILAPECVHRTVLELRMELPPAPVQWKRAEMRPLGATGRQMEGEMNAGGTRCKYI